MKNILLLLCFTFGTGHAQEYISLDQNDWVYDVDVIVFARQLAQPDAETINSSVIEPLEPLKTLYPLSEELPLFKAVELDLLADQQNATENNKQWQVPLGEDKQLVDVLTWFIVENNMQHPIIEKLQLNPTFKPLHHQKWRQPEVSFLQPIYVKVSSDIPPLATPPFTDEQETVDVEMNSDIAPTDEAFILNINETQTPEDYSFDGQVAFSMQRFNHISVLMNFFRIDPNGNPITYNIKQKSRVELNQWQYFDHQQFGVLTKVTAIKIEENHENN